ncbi:MAG: SLBB domain-containing protein, partial [Bacteroidota bacterium]
MINKLLGTLLLLLVSYSFSFSQNIPIDPDRARIELERRGLDEDQVRQKLLEKGIDINNIDPSQIGEVEQALEEAIRELEEENQRAASQTANEITNEATRAIQEEISDVAKEATEEINESVEEGKPLDQAISEEIIDAQLDPPASGVYGQQIFRDKSIGVFSKSVDALPPDSYVIGPGDRVTISIWGLSQEDATYKVQDGGYIKPSGMPRINLQGITYESAKRLLESRYSQYYRFRPEEFEMTITYSRNINVNIYGEVFNPGTFNLPATNTAFNSLVAAGGPSNIGSVRNIRLIRGGEVKEIDVYDFMMDPTVREKFYLQDNDIIHVGVADRLIRISGAVKRPFVYELKKDENLVQLIEYAGGLRDNAYQSNIQVKRYVDDLEKIIDVDLRTILAEGKDFILESGDEVLINNIPKPYKNFVEISGAAELPARYELTDSMRILDLLAKGQPSEDARTDIAFLIRTNPDQTINYERLNLDLAQSQPEGINNPVLQPKDRLFLLSKVNYVDIATFTINGAVRKPSEYSYDPRQSLRIEDAIILAGGLRPDATNFAYISRVDPSNTDNIEYIRVQLDKAMQDPNSGNNLYLQANDVLYIYSNLLYTDEFFVSVQGAVRQPGKFQYDESLTLRDLLTMAGGLKLEAATSRVDISRLIIRDNEPTKVLVG